MCKLLLPSCTWRSTGEAGSGATYTVAYASNRLGEARAVTDQNGTTHAYTRDGLGRVTSDRATFYPVSSSGTDGVFHAYNAQGERVWTRDQIGDVLDYAYDTAGRVTSVAATLATSPASPTDGAVLRIETGYDNRGLVSTVTSFDAASAGTALDQVKHTYDAWGNIALIEQDRDSVVGGSGVAAYTVGFAHDEAEPAGLTRAFRRIHRTEVLYPAGHVLDFHFGQDLDSIGLPTQVNLALGRVETVRITPPGGYPVDAAVYEYLGLGRVVRTDLAEAGLWSAVSTASSAYPGLDRFDRIVESSWMWDDASGLDRNGNDLGLAYDRNSSIVWAEDRWCSGRAAGRPGLTNPLGVRMIFPDRNRIETRPMTIAHKLRHPKGAIGVRGVRARVGRSGS